MTIAESIEILTSLKSNLPPKKAPELHQAINLGIEALTKHHNRHTQTFADMLAPLTSETQEIFYISPKASHASKA